MIGKNIWTDTIDEIENIHKEMLGDIYNEEESEDVDETDEVDEQYFC